MKKSDFIGQPPARAPYPTCTPRPAMTHRSFLAVPVRPPASLDLYASDAGTPPWIGGLSHTAWSSCSRNGGAGVRAARTPRLAPLPEPSPSGPALIGAAQRRTPIHNPEGGLHNAGRRTTPDAAAQRLRGITRCTTRRTEYGRTCLTVQAPPCTTGLTTACTTVCTARPMLSVLLCRILVVNQVLPFLCVVRCCVKKYSCHLLETRQSKSNTFTKLSLESRCKRTATPMEEPCK